MDASCSGAGVHPMDPAIGKCKCNGILENRSNFRKLSMVSILKAAFGLDDTK